MSAGQATAQTAGPDAQANAREDSGKQVMAAEDAFALAVRHFQAGELVQAETILRQLDAAFPGNPDILCNLAAIACTVGKPEAALPMLDQALAAKPGHGLCRSLKVKATLMRAQRLRAEGDMAGALALARELVAEDPGDPSVRVDLTRLLHAAGARAAITDFAPEMRPEELGTHLFVACMPKSGSTFLVNALSTLTQYPTTFFTYAFVHNEQELYLPYLLRAARDNTVTQQHCRATAPNLQLMTAFGIRPVVLVRNIFDIAVSLKDFYDQGAANQTFHREAWPHLDEARKYDLVIDAVLPWYFQFYVSWVEAEAEGRIDMTWQTYEEMIADKPAALARIADFLGLETGADEIAAVIRGVEGNRGATRFNKGVAGRGAQVLSAEQKARIERLAAYYPGVDFARIGL